jgi:hypothetical protein
MTTLPRMTRARSVALLLTGVGWMALEKWARRTRATSDEKHKRLPGDELVARPMWQATRAITIHAPRDAVWPWLAQMGYPTHRAGWYTPYWMDRVIFRIRARSADCIIPELQNLAPGDRVPDSPDGVVSYFTVAEIAKGRALVLISHTHPLPIYRDVDFSWAFALEDAGASADTRLIMRARVAYTPVGPGPVIQFLVAAGFGIGDVLQAGAMLGGIKARAEPGGATRVP